MRVFFSFLGLIFFLFFSTPALACELGVYTDDSVAARGGLGAAIFPEFEKLTGCKVRVVAAPDAVQVLGRVEIDLKRGKPAADVIVGVDSANWNRVKLLAVAKTKADRATVEKMNPIVRDALASFPGLVPYDFGALAFIADSEALAHSKLTAPVSLRDLLKPEWNKNFILEDPRASSPGLQFLLFSKRALGKDFGGYWKNLRSQWLAMPPSWNSAYGLFVEGGVPLVWSYVTSEAFHRAHGSGDRYRAVILKEGQPIQIEGAVEVRGARNHEAAQKFLSFLLSREVQDQIGGKNWMWPVLKDARVPKSFSRLPALNHPSVLEGASSVQALRDWSKAIHE